MLTTSGDIYASKALDQIPRLLSNQDRNSLSPTYGCFHRDYWLDKTSDFPDAVRQFAAQALALVYRCQFPGNEYHGRWKVRDWAIAGLVFWTQIQHRDGSFDEFYPYERGWVGPSAFTTFTSIETYNLLEAEIPTNIGEQIRHAIRRAAYFIAAGQSEEDHLANHHAMACLAVWKAYRLLGDPGLKEGYQRLWNGFLGYHNQEEGWSREYDGVDPGYLSATVSFLSKIYQDNRDVEIFEVLRQSVEFCSYFVYPDGFYAGSLGSRSTLHFYPHGFEILAGELPIAAAVAERTRAALAEGKLVPPGIMSDRYVVYRVPEFLQAYLDHDDRIGSVIPLPYKREPFTQYFPAARIAIANRPDHYAIGNLAKGGTVKVFDRHSNRPLLNDCGVIGRLVDNRVVSSQWIDPACECQSASNGWEVTGTLHVIPSHKLFTPAKNLLFRSALVCLGWSSTLCHLLKARIRKHLILGERPLPILFRRRLHFEGDHLTLTDELQLEGALQFRSLMLGGHFDVRHVPQSRYFQSQEFAGDTTVLNADQLRQFNETKRLRLSRTLGADGLSQTLDINNEPASLPEGVSGVEYYLGRKQKRQLIYRLARRTDEVAEALRRHSDGHLRVLVDVGTADGLMLEGLRDRLGPLTFLGVDLSFDLLRAISIPGVQKARGDAPTLPVRNGVADAVVATAVIEHVPKAGSMLQECARVLRPGGLLVVTTPGPSMDRIAALIGLLKESGHNETFNLHQLRALAESNGFVVLEAQKFMFSPIGFPGEKRIERMLQALSLGFVMANQLLVAQRM